MDAICFLLFLAQATPKGDQKPGMDMWLIMLVPIVIFFFWMKRSQKKREQKR